MTKKIFLSALAAAVSLSFIVVGSAEAKMMKKPMMKSHKTMMMKKKPMMKKHMMKKPMMKKM